MEAGGGAFVCAETEKCGEATRQRGKGRESEGMGGARQLGRGMEEEGARAGGERGREGRTLGVSAIKDEVGVVEGDTLCGSEGKEAHGGASEED